MIAAASDKQRCGKVTPTQRKSPQTQNGSGGVPKILSGRNKAAHQNTVFFNSVGLSYLLCKKIEPMSCEFPHKSSALRLAFGSLITVVCKFFTSIRISCLHLGQYKGKFFNSVSSRICSRVLLPQTGQRTHSVFSIMIPLLCYPV